MGNKTERVKMTMICTKVISGPGGISEVHKKFDIRAEIPAASMEYLASWSYGGSVTTQGKGQAAVYFDDYVQPGEESEAEKQAAALAAALEKQAAASGIYLDSTGEVLESYKKFMEGING